MDKHFIEGSLRMFKIKSKFVNTACMVLSNLTSSPLSDLASLHPLFVPCAQWALQDFLQKATGHWHLPSSLSEIKWPSPSLGWIQFKYHLFREVFPDLSG